MLRNHSSAATPIFGLVVGVTLGLGAAAATTGAARADARIVTGGPTAKGQRAKVEASLERAAADTAVCWRDADAKPVRVELAVDARGRVTRSAHKTRGAVAQCVAGVLAVQRLARAGGGYRLVVELSGAPRGRATGGSVGDDAAGIERDLAPYRRKLDDCFQQATRRRRSLAGRAVVQFRIRPDGRIASPSVKSSTLGDAGAEECFVDVMARARIGAGLVAKEVPYALTLDFAGGASGGGAGGGAPAGERGLQPKKEGPLSGGAISKVMNARRSKFTACYDRVARRKPKLAGHVVLRFTIRGDGTVRNAKTRETTLNNAAVEGCLVGVVQKLRFPADPGGGSTRVFYPLSFSRK